MSIYGPIVTAKRVRLAVQDTMKLWSPAYLAEVSRQDGRNLTTDLLPPFGSYSASADFDKWTEDLLPACVVVVAGLGDDPVKRGKGEHDATWAVGVGAVVGGMDRDSSRELAELYAAAIRMVVLQHGSLGGFAKATYWIDERYDALPDTDTVQRSLMGALVQFQVVVHSVANAQEGPITPPGDPVVAPGEWGSIGAVLPTVVPKS